MDCVTRRPVLPLGWPLLSVATGIRSCACLAGWRSRSFSRLQGDAVEAPAGAPAPVGAVSASVVLATICGAPQGSRGRAQPWGAKPERLQERLNLGGFWQCRYRRKRPKVTTGGPPAQPRSDPRHPLEEDDGGREAVNPAAPPSETGPPSQCRDFHAGDAVIPVSLEESGAAGTTEPDG